MLPEVSLLLRASKKIPLQHLSQLFVIKRRSPKRGTLQSRREDIKINAFEDAIKLIEVDLEMLGLWILGQVRCHDERELRQMRVELQMRQIMLSPQHLDNFVWDRAIGTEEHVCCERAELVQCALLCVEMARVDLDREQTGKLVTFEKKGRIAFKKPKERRARISGLFDDLEQIEPLKALGTGAQSDRGYQERNEAIIRDILRGCGFDFRNPRLDQSVLIGGLCRKVEVCYCKGRGHRRAMVLEHGWNNGLKCRFQGLSRNLSRKIELAILHNITAAQLKSTAWQFHAFYDCKQCFNKTLRGRVSPRFPRIDPAVNLVATGL